jgi:predicted Zn-dependent protease
MRLDAGDAPGAGDAATRAFVVRRRDQSRETVVQLAEVLVDLGRGREAATLLRPHVIRTGDAGLADMLARAQAAAGLERRALGTCQRARGAGIPGPFCAGMLARDLG